LQARVAGLCRLLLIFQRKAQEARQCVVGFEFLQAAAERATFEAEVTVEL
jgi:hypothetical protein